MNSDGGQGRKSPFEGGGWICRRDEDGEAACEGGGWKRERVAAERMKTKVISAIKKSRVM